MAVRREDDVVEMIEGEGEAGPSEGGHSEGEEEGEEEEESDD